MEYSGHRHETVGETEPPRRRRIANAGQSQPAWQRGEGSRGSFYYNTPGHAVISFHYVDDLSKRYFSQNWSARISVKSSDVASLMRDGFDWDETNIMGEEGHMNRDVSRGDWRHYLKDLQEPPRWVAMIEVSTRRYGYWRRIDLKHLTRERMMSVVVWGQQGGAPVYRYDYKDPSKCYNLIYGNMPLRGRWPWPRSNEAEVNDHVGNDEPSNLPAAPEVPTGNEVSP
ncbi:hypothetical protein GGR50DRAFT_668004 [Xylaria sp. CBS 124048]|nr:hypothetical protein GGR50DRAFT_668004 [Xylaria sp. CBS 124048]